MSRQTPPDESLDEPTYDPCAREPRTFWELGLWAAHWEATLRSPRLRSPVIARGDDNHFLEKYCIDQFGGMNLDALRRLHARYAVRTGKTTNEIEATTLREMAAAFRPTPAVASGDGIATRNDPVAVGAMTTASTREKNSVSADTTAAIVAAMNASAVHRLDRALSVLFERRANELETPAEEFRAVRTRHT